MSVIFQERHKFRPGKETVICSLQQGPRRHCGGFVWEIGFCFAWFDGTVFQFLRLAQGIQPLISFKRFSPEVWLCVLHMSVGSVWSFLQEGGTESSRCSQIHLPLQPMCSLSNQSGRAALPEDALANTDSVLTYSTYLPKCYRGQCRGHQARCAVGLNRIWPWGQP